MLYLPITVAARTGIDLQDYKGKVVYVDFWASWCKPCRASFPFMHELAAKYNDSLVIVAINVDENRHDADRFLQDFDINFNIVFDPEGHIAESYDIKGMPSSYLYDRQGRLLGSHVGFRQKDSATIEAAIAEAIGAGE